MPLHFIHLLPLTVIHPAISYSLLTFHVLQSIYCHQV